MPSKPHTLTDHDALTSYSKDIELVGLSAVSVVSTVQGVNEGNDCTLKISGLTYGGRGVELIDLHLAKAGQVSDGDPVADNLSDPAAFHLNLKEAAFTGLRLVYDEGTLNTGTPVLNIEVLGVPNG